MKQQRLFVPLLLLLAGISLQTFAATGVKVSGDPTQRLILENLDLSGSAFFSAYMSKDISQRRLAEMYLAGVLDAGEGKRWCSYAIALPHSLQELIYAGFERQAERALKRRASEVINDILAHQLPCRRTK